MYTVFPQKIKISGTIILTRSHSLNWKI